jgi:hypothetical protein
MVDFFISGLNSMRTLINTFVVVALATHIPHSTQAQNSRPIVAVFAHSDDERVIGPLLSRPGTSVFAELSCQRSNGSVQIQAHYHHCGEAGSERCLAVATFVR